MKLIKKSFAIIILSLFPMPWNEFFQGNLSHFPGMECANSKRCLIWVSRRESLKLTSLPWKLVDLENDLLITFPFKVSLASAVVLLLMEDIRKSPVEVGSLSHYLQGFKHPRWFRISSINSFILPFKLSSYVFWVCSNCGAFRVTQFEQTTKSKSPWAPNVPGFHGSQREVLLKPVSCAWGSWVDGSNTEETNKQILDAEPTNTNPHSSVFSKEFSYTVLVGGFNPVEKY